MLAVLALALMVAALFLLPLLILRVAFGLLFGLIFLPFKLLGVVLKIVFGVVGLVFRVLFSGVGLVFALLAAVFFVVLLPLLPFALLGFGLWLVLRQSRRAAPSTCVVCWGPLVAPPDPSRRVNPARLRVRGLWRATAVAGSRPFEPAEPVLR